MKLFLSSLRSEKTKEDYLRYLEQFRQYAKFEFYDEFIERDHKQIKNIVEDWVLELRETMTPNSVPTHYYSIQSFLEMNDVLLNFKKLRKLLPEKVKTAIERGWTTEEVQKMLSVCDSLRTRAIILFEASSGGRLGVIDGLKIKHLKEITDEKHGKCYAIVGYHDEKEEYITFLTPEATKSLDDYFNSRKNISPDSPVFTRLNSEEEIVSKSLGKAVTYVQRKSGLRNPKDKKGSRFNIATNHGFRHRFNEIVKSNNVINPHIAERLLSHSSKLIPLDTIYFNPNIDTLFLEYKKLISLLTIDDSDRLLVENQSIKVERSEYEKIKQKLEEHEQLLKIYKMTAPITKQVIS